MSNASVIKLQLTGMLVRDWALFLGPVPWPPSGLQITITSLQLSLSRGRRRGVCPLIPVFTCDSMQIRMLSERQLYLGVSEKLGTMGLHRGH